MPIPESYLGIGTPIVQSIIYEQLISGNGFIPLLTNTCLSFPHQDITLDTLDLWENWSANKMTLPKDSVSSRQGGQVSLDFQEYAGAPVSSLIRLWVEYIDGVSKGRFYPKERYLNIRVLDYAVTIFVFLLEPDGRTIEWGSKYTGCFPSAIPGSAFTGHIGSSDGVKVSVPFNYSYYETMDPAIMSDFNSAYGDDPEEVPSLELGAVRPADSTRGSGSVAVVPEKIPGTNKTKYLLKFPRFEDNTAIQKIGL